MKFTVLLLVLLTTSVCSAVPNDDETELLIYLMRQCTHINKVFPRGAVLSPSFYNDIPSFPECGKLCFDLEGCQAVMYNPRKRSFELRESGITATIFNYVDLILIMVLNQYDNKLSCSRVLSILLRDLDKY
ncbi:hypothetical protein ACHWQZ_G011886 [Mnemiopsis leidyi]